jgi:hypothetical protein
VSALNSSLSSAAIRFAALQSRGLLASGSFCAMLGLFCRRGGQRRNLLVRSKIYASQEALSITPPCGGIIASLIELLLFLPRVAIFVRRLHDIDRSGWWDLLLFVSVIGGPMMLGLRGMGTKPLPRGDIMRYQDLMR